MLSAMTNLQQHNTTVNICASPHSPWEETASGCCDIAVSVPSSQNETQEQVPSSSSQ